MKREGIISSQKKAQITIFIIIAIMIIIIAVLLFMFFPGAKNWFGEEENPSAYIQNCIEKDVKIAVDKLSPQGGSIEPKHYILYNDEKIEYLCYTQDYYKTCVMQQPMLKNHIESEIENEINAKSDECFDDMKTNFEKKGYNVNLVKGNMNVELLPKRISVNFNSSLTLLKGEESQKYQSFSVALNNNLYELVSIANSILNWEARYGDAETTIYMNYYHDLKVEKKLQGDGTTIYILTDRNNGNKFQFASRSVAWPPGYGQTAG